MVAGKKSLLSKFKRNEKLSKNNFYEVVHYLTFLNFGALINIILKLKNNIEIVKVGTMYKIKSAFNKEGVPANIKCRK